MQERRPAKYRHAYLLTSLFLLIVVQPFVQERSPVDLPWVSDLHDLTVIDTLFMITLFAGAYAVATSRRQLIAIATLGGVSAALRILWHPDSVDDLEHVGFFVAYQLVTMTYFVLVLVALARPLFAPRERITTDTLFGALSLYLLIGLAWSGLYALLEHAEPGSFMFPATEGSDGVADGTDFERFLGFSFTTLTTLGYGNIAPTNPRADALTSLEAIVGQIYLAVIVARLVALQTTQAQSRTEQPAS